MALAGTCPCSPVDARAAGRFATVGGSEPQGLRNLGGVRGSPESIEHHWSAARRGEMFSRLREMVRTRARGEWRREVVVRADPRPIRDEARILALLEEGC